MASDALIVFCTLPDDDDAAANVLRPIVDEKLAACVNLLPRIRSIYSWQGEVCDDPERLAVIKTTTSRFEALRARLVELHPYECPEVIATPIERGHQPYLDWVVEMTT